MPVRVPEMTAKQVRDLSAPGLKAVGGVSGLHLQVTESGAKSWILRVSTGVQRTSKNEKPFVARRDIGLGGFPDVTLAMARERAREAKEKLRKGIDPVAEKKALRSAMLAGESRSVTFCELAKIYIIRKGKEYKGAKQLQKLQNQMDSYAIPFIGNMMVSDIEMSHVVDMLTPIWETKTETATRVRLHVEKILDIAIADKKRSGVNPARWKGMLEHSSLPAPGKVSKVTHHAALPVGDMPAFWQKLQQAKGTGARTLQFIILTACRSGEARGATWEEVDFDNKTWTIPAERMKAAKDHVIPLTDEAVKLLEDTPRLGKYLFTGGRGGQISDVMVSKVPKILGHDVTAHGFRSTFKDWSRLHTAYPDEVSELQLAHVNNDATRAAYARDGLLNKRRLLMQEWAHYCYHGHIEKSNNVVQIGGAK
jgi:integrase